MTKTHYYVLQAFEVAEDQIVVAKSAKKARKWYKKNITDDVFAKWNVRVCGMEETYFYDESRTTTMTLEQCIDEHLKAGDKVPFLAVTTDA